MEFDAEHPKSTKGAHMKMMEFWQKNYHRGLHDILQGQNGWLLKKKREGNETVSAYINTLSGAHSMLLNDPEIPGTEF